MRLRREPVDRISVVGNAVETSRPVMAGHPLAITPASAPVVLESDAVRLAQVIANLQRQAIAAGFEHHPIKPAKMEALLSSLEWPPAPEQPVAVTPPFP